jgi:hypothetical protein
MRHEFDDYFPMKDYPNEGVTGAYSWLIGRGYQNLIQAIQNEATFNTNSRRLLLVGLISQKGLTDEFMQTCWIQGRRNPIERQNMMYEWYERFKKRSDLVGWLRSIIASQVLLLSKHD